MNLRYRLRERSIRSLSHPISIGAIFLLLINDHWLRWHYPSWGTGKIGDFAWLIFAPLLAILLFSCVFPTSKLCYVDLVSFISVGLVFILGNTVVSFHETLVSIFHLIVGWKPLMYRDPTDLLMVPAIFIGWKIWQTTKATDQFRLRPFRNQKVGWVMLPLAVLSTIANSPSFDDYGVYCVAQDSEKLMAFIGGGFPEAMPAYESQDGGITWTRIDDYTTMIPLPCAKESIPWEIVDPSNENIHWRIKETGASIEQSHDAGETWTTLYVFPTGAQVRKYYYRPHPQNWGPQGEIILPGGPYNGIVDEVTGNLIVSMGFEGVLVITLEKEIIRTDVDAYTFVDIHEISLYDRLFNEVTLAFWLVCLVVSILSIPLWPNSRWKVIVILSVVFWLLVSLFLREMTIVDIVYQLFTYFFVWLIYPILAIVAGVKIVQKHSWHYIGLVLGTAIISVTLFMIPLLFWATGKVSSYQMAMLLSIIIMSVPIFFSYRRIRDQQHL
jgi:hypothetical protein